jgi:GNAT superfamily N-acetyltransferase
MIIQPILRYLRIAGGVPREFPGSGVVTIKFSSFRVEPSVMMFRWVPRCGNIVAGVRSRDAIYMFCFPLIGMSNPTVVFEPYAAAIHRDIVQTIVDSYNIAATGQAEWYPVVFFLKDENGEILGGLLGDIWAAWLHVRTLAVAMPVRKHGFGKELMKRAETYAIERGCTDAYLDTFSFQARPFYEKLGYRVFGTLENHPSGRQHFFMTKKLDSCE